MKITTTSTILSRCLKAVSTFCSKDESRFHLNGVLFEAKASSVHIVATDGHTLCAAEPIHTKTEVQGEVIVSLECIKRIITMCKGRDDRPVTITIYEGKKEIVVGNESMPLQIIKSSFPPWRKICPASSGRSCDSGIVGLDPVYLVRAGKAGKDFRTNKEHGVKFSIGGELDPVRIDQHCYDTGGLTVIIMPMRI